ncbi:MAG: 23S rRNA (adenine(2503)-C(2))-methyltransferase RlmN [Bacteroidota bacterium]
MKSNIKSLSKEDLTNFILRKNYPRYRAEQIFDWIWKKGIKSFRDMKNIPVKLISDIEIDFEFHEFFINKIQKSKDNTIKVAFKLFDGLLTEGVLIFAETRRTACISVQTACPLKCTFCASGNLTDGRNLSFGEIHDQIICLNNLSIKEKNAPLSNLVFMGIGEPFLNYENLKKSIHIITSPEILNFSPSRITVSTAGLTEKIIHFADENLKTKLAVSLHSADNLKRTKIMPVNQSNNLTDLKNSIIYFNQKTGLPVTLEYLMLSEFNDNIYDAKKLISFCKGLNVKINLIEYNQAGNILFKPSDKKRIKAFKDTLESYYLIVTIRNSKGADINAACGQLSASLAPDNKDNTQ